jgi:hypothetical protein
VWQRQYSSGTCTCVASTVAVNPHIDIDIGSDWHRIANLPVSAGITIVNPENSSRTFALPKGRLGKWLDVYGGAVADPNAVQLPPASGLVLLLLLGQ